MRAVGGARIVIPAEAGKGCYRPPFEPPGTATAGAAWRGWG